MRFMIMVMATPRSEEGGRVRAEDLPVFEEMGAYHEELARAGVLLDGAGLRPTRDAWRQRYAADGRTEILDGPFAETKELVAGYTLIQVRSREEAMEWARRFPRPFRGIDCEIQVRQLYEEADFAPGGDMAPL
jgi:hypothetical protein